MSVSFRFLKSIHTGFGLLFIEQLVRMVMLVLTNIDVAYPATRINMMIIEITGLMTTSGY
jgi:hypothetical protein